MVEEVHQEVAQEAALAVAVAVAALAVEEVRSCFDTESSGVLNGNRSGHD